MQAEHDGSAIQDFFRNQNIFITGGTGFLGKALVEKLIRACPDLGNIYLLIRPNSKWNAEQRLEELLKSSLFNKVRKESTDGLSKVIPIHGDMTLPNMGISELDQKLLCDQVSIVIHSAATVKFDEQLDIAIEINVNGTKRIVDLARKMINLKALIHISTAYANCDKLHIDERIYPLNKHISMKLLENSEDDFDKVLEGRPNTYTFTKALGEQILQEWGNGLPICIIRPSIIGATWREPVAGWVDNYIGATGIMCAAGMGILKTIHMDDSKTADLIPLDLLVNFILTSAWATAIDPSSSPKVYHCCTGTDNSIKWADILTMTNNTFRKYPLSSALGYPKLSNTKLNWWNDFKDFWYQYLPALVMDCVVKLVGNKPRMLKLWDIVTKSARVCDHFVNNEWHFETTNVKNVYLSLSPEDKRLFNFNVKVIRWKEYMELYGLGIRRYVLKDNDSTLPKARNRMFRLYMLNKMGLIVLILAIFCLARYTKLPLLLTNN